jgi:amino acid transporter
MQHLIISGLAIVGTCLVIALVVLGVFVFRPRARRHGRHRRHSERQRIDLFAQPPEPPAKPDA